MVQILSENNRKGALLDLFINAEGLVGEVTIGGCLGHSNHEEVGSHSNHEEVEIKIFGDRRKIATRTSTLDLCKADFRLLG